MARFGWIGLVMITAVSIACAVEAPGDGSLTTNRLQVEVNHQGTLQSRVLKVIDGATIDVEADGRIFRVRYLGVEIPDNDIQELALQFNRFLVAGQTIEFDASPVTSDSTGDLVGYVYVGGEMVNTALIASGFAVVADFPASFEHREAFLLAEDNARASGRGLWSFRTAGSLPQPPYSASPSSAPTFSGGTLPPLPAADTPEPACDYSGTEDPVIKGIIEPDSGERVYIPPGDPEYATSAVNEAEDGRWFCTEFEAIAAGWKKSN